MVLNAIQNTQVTAPPTPAVVLPVGLEQIAGRLTIMKTSPVAIVTVPKVVVVNVIVLVEMSDLNPVFRLVTMVVVW